MTRVRALARFRRGQHVRVRESVLDARYAGRLGTVLEVLEPRRHYRRGCVRVALDWPRTYEVQETWFGCRPPRAVHFCPADLRRA